MPAIPPASTGARFRSLIWLMPASFAPHILEEFAAGFPGWVTDTLGSPMSAGGFLLNNAAFMAILLGLTGWAWRRPSPLPAFLLLCWASGNLFWNFVFHLATTFLYDRFSPGLLTAVALYFPISIVVAWAAVSQRALPLPAFAGAVAVGAALMLFVIWAGLFQFAL